GAIQGIQNIVFRETLRAQLASDHRMRSQRPRRHCAAILHADLDPAAHRTIAARGGHPAVRNFLRRRVAGRFSARIRVLFLQSIEADETLPIHAAALFVFTAASGWTLVKAVAIFFGTTLT